MEKRMNGLKNHFVVCGFGRMGKIICQQLYKNNEKFIIIDNNKEKVNNAINEGYIVLEGNCLDDSILGKTNLKKAKGLVSVLGKEEDNLFVTLSARGASSDLFIIAKNSYEFNRKKFLTAGANKVLNPYEIAGHSLANMVTRPAVVDFLEIIREGTEVDWEMDEIQVQENADIAGKEIRECYNREELDIIIAAIQRKNGEMTFNPRGRTKVEVGDMLIAMGYLDNLKHLEKLCGIIN
jgi:voltage-gated potassium channel